MSPCFAGCRHERVSSRKKASFLIRKSFGPMSLTKCNQAALAWKLSVYAVPCSQTLRVVYSSPEGFAKRKRR